MLWMGVVPCVPDCGLLSTAYILTDVGCRVEGRKPRTLGSMPRHVTWCPGADAENRGIEKPNTHAAIFAAAEYLHRVEDL